MTSINICKKMHLGTRGDVWTMLGGAKIYAPLYPWDYIQRIIVDSDNFFELDILSACAPYIPANATILDAGANIGNHSLFWATECGAKKIHAFEPVATSYDCLVKNIALNNLQGVIIPYDFALGHKSDRAKIKKNYGDNIGMTSLAESPAGKIQIRRYDELDIASEHIDFAKIDVEGFELKALAGMREMLARDRPPVLIETFADDYAAVKSFFDGLDYTRAAKFEDSNYLFVP